MRPSLAAKLDKVSPLHFCGLRSEVTNFSYRKFYGACIVLESTLPMKIDSTIIWVSFSREILFMHGLLGKLLSLNRYTFVFLYITHIHTCWTRNNGCLKFFKLISGPKQKLYTPVCIKNMK